VAASDGSHIVRGKAVGSPETPEHLGEQVWQILLDSGAPRLLADASSD
jgi:hypothetical protein